MRNLKPQKSQNTLQGNILARSNKLTIEVPDEEGCSSAQKFNKNSPTYSKASNENQRCYGTPSCPKPRTPASARSAKRPLAESGTPLSSSKLFKFPQTPKTITRKPSRPIQLITKRNKSKVVAPAPKHSSTPTHRNSSEELKKRPRTATATEKPSIKAETAASPALNTMVTQVKTSQPKPVSTLSEQEIQARSEMLYREHLFQTFQALKFVRTLQPVNIEQLKEKRVNIPRRKGFENKKTLVFDLDETLVHCCEEGSEEKPMVVLPVVFPTGEIVQAGINIRPYALECLKEANKDFEVFVFTASHPCYANVVLDYLDPKKELIHQRFFRDSCISMGGVFIKDLRIFANRSMKDIIIVDNAAYSFAYQLDNGIPIVSWHEDPYDKELYNLMDYIKALAGVDDIREVNEKTFHLRSFYEDYITEFLNAEAVSSPKSGKKS